MNTLQHRAVGPITALAGRLGLSEDEVVPYGREMAKVRLDARARLADRPTGKYVVVTGITPSPPGEGKTVTAIGLAQALERRGQTAVACLRQPSQAPTFGAKGGGAGGGAAHVEPLADVNLHLTGDFHAVAAAQNLLAAAVDDHLYRGNALGIDPQAVAIRRVLDVDDRALRHVVVGLGGREDGVPRETGFEVTAASEVMAILALAADHGDLRARLGRMVAAYRAGGGLVTAEALRVAGAMAALLKDALLPNLLQSGEGTPVFMHAGPFGNIAHGNSSVVADQIALRLADYVVTEAGFGADMGLEKFADIKCRASGLAPDCVVLVATVRALLWHGATKIVRQSAPAAAAQEEPGAGEDLAALDRGCANLVRQVQNARRFGVPVVVAINRFPGDTEAALHLVGERALAAGAEAAAVSSAWADGGAGGLALAGAVEAACRRPGAFRPLYPDALPIAEKLAVVAREMYGAAGVEYAPEARRALVRLRHLDLERLPVCVAKTHLSLSHDPRRRGAPSGFTLPVRDLRLAAGAGFVYALCGEIRTMPGLPVEPAFAHIDLQDSQVAGLH